jgi:hypothetical protein
MTMSANPYFTGEANGEIAQAFYTLLAEALLRSEILNRERIPIEAVSDLDRACLRYAEVVPKSIATMILTKAGAEGHT